MGVLKAAHMRQLEKMRLEADWGRERVAAKRKRLDILKEELALEAEERELLGLSCTVNNAS